MFPGREIHLVRGEFRFAAFGVGHGDLSAYQHHRQLLLLFIGVDIEGGSQNLDTRAFGLDHERPCQVMGDFAVHLSVDVDFPPVAGELFRVDHFRSGIYPQPAAVGEDQCRTFAVGHG